MDSYQYLFSRMSLLTGTGIFLYENDSLKEYRDNTDYNPIVQSTGFRMKLAELADRQEVPVLYQDDNQVFFGCIRRQTEYIMLGPMSIQYLSGVELHRYYREYGMKRGMEKAIPVYTLSQMLALLQIISKEILEKEFSDEILIKENHLAEEIQKTISEEQIIFKIREEEQENSHHTYMEERKLLECVREGNVEEALQRNRDMDAAMGRLSGKEINHWRNLLVISVTLCTRAAIEGGLPPADAYVISDFYIHKSDMCTSISALSSLKNQAVKELTERVCVRKDIRLSSNHIEQCKDYISKNYKQKIYLKDMADSLGLSSTYLSRLFSKETGMRLQDYINWFKTERAANLLIYSEESIACIAEYVNFPNQSYFGKIFKQFKEMTPAEFRNRYKMIEFSTSAEK